MTDELSKFYRDVASRNPLRVRILAACLVVQMLSLAAGHWLEVSRIGLHWDWILVTLPGCVLLPLCGFAWTLRLNDRIRVGQIVLAHGGRGVVELKLGPGSTLRGDASRIGWLTRHIDEECWADLKLFARTAVWTEDRLKGLGFATRRSGAVMSLAGHVSYPFNWIGWAVGRAIRGRKPPRFAQRGPWVEGETDLRSYVRRWSGRERPRRDGTLDS